jgi:hypothetical protein
MPTFQCGEFRVWFGTDDAPAPTGAVPRGGEQAVRVGVLPRDSDIVVRIRYRRQGGSWMSLPTRALPATGDDGPQYYEGRFGDLAPGVVIEYTVQCQLQGRNIEPSDSATVSFEVEKAARRTKAGTSSSLRSSAAPLVGPETSTVTPLVLTGPARRAVVSERAAPQPEAVRFPMTAEVRSEAETADANAGRFMRTAGVPAAGAPSTDVVPVESSTEVLNESTAPATDAPATVPPVLTMVPAVFLPVTVTLAEPTAEPLTVKATFAIFSFDAKPRISQRDFYFYELSAEVSGAGAFQVLRPSFENDLKVTCRTVPIEDLDTGSSLLKHLCSTHVRFPDGPPVVRAGTAVSVRVIVKSFEGARVWSQEFRADDPRLHDLYIEVPLQRPIVLTPSGKRPKSPHDKKLRGQILDLNKKCKLKDLAVVIQARTPGDATWRIVAAGRTDGAGNFSLPYPFGVFEAAQALVSAAPNDPAAVRVTAVRNDNETIADDFLYLLLKGIDCGEEDETDDCDCNGKHHPARLPDQADLIGSDEYTQDIGGSCINLSTPNRTLSEFNYQAIVRTSDPDVANYTLVKVPDVKPAGIDPVRVFELGRAAAALDSGVRQLTLQGALPPAASTAAAAQIAPLRANIERGSNADVTAAIKSVDALVATLISSLTPAGTNTATPTNTGSGLSTAASIEKEIERVVLAFRNVLGDPSGLSWERLEGAIRQAVINAGGAPLAPTFFFQFPEWGGAGGFVGATNTGLLTRVSQAAAAAGAASAADASALAPPIPGANAVSYLVALANDLKANLNAAQLIRAETSYQLISGAQKRLRERVDLNNMVAWHDDDRRMTLFQAVTVATGHVLHFKSEFKADGYSLGDVVYSLPLAPGQKKAIVVLDASHRLMGTESQTVSQAERLAAGIVDERSIISGLGGRIAESLRGASSANTSGISAGFGTGGQGYGGSGGQGGYGGSGSAVIGVAGGVANSNSNAWQESSRDMSQHFAETLRQSIMQNADAYRQLNASVVTTVEEGQRYGVTSEVVANHNHCHALTIMYFEVLRHYAIFQRLSSVEECVFVPLLMTNFAAPNICKWRDILATSLLPMATDTYLQSLLTATSSPQQHPLLRAFDANERILTNYANVDYPVGAYDDEAIQFIRGTMRIRVELPRPRTRFDRIMSLPVTKKLDAAALADAVQQFARDSATYGAKVAFTAGIWSAFEAPPKAPNPEAFQVMATEAISDAFMTMDANYESVPPAQSMRIINFKPKPISVDASTTLMPAASAGEFFADNLDDRKQWEAYSQILGYSDVETMLNAYFKGNLIAEWDSIFETDIAPLVFEKIISRISLSEFSTDFSSNTKYRGGERSIRLNVTGATSKRRNQLPIELTLAINDPNFKKLQNYITFVVEDLTISYSTAHYNGVLYSGNVNDDLFDDTSLYIPENSEEKRNPRKEDAYLVYKLIEHLNSHIEYYNKALWFNLDPDRRYMLLDGFDIPIFNDYGLPIGRRSLASVVKNELITITGNSLVLPVAAGYRVSQSYIVEESADAVEIVSLLDHYQPLTPIEPYRISVPTRGVFAEAVQGACNACEKIETDRLQDWTKFPNTDEPTSISPVVVPTPSVADWKAAFKDLATPIVNIQNAPAAPAPGAGLAGLSDALTKSGVFKDITGLDANQQNVIRTYLSNQENAKAFGEMAKEMAMQQHNTQNSPKIMDQITAAKNAKDITPQEAGQLVKDHLQQQIDGGVAKKAELNREKQLTPLTKAAMDAASRGREVKVQREGETESVDISRAGESEVAAEILRNIPGQSIASIETAETKVRTAAASVSASTQTDSDAPEREISPEGLISPAQWWAQNDADLVLWNFGVNSADVKRFEVALNLDLADPENPDRGTPAAAVSRLVREVKEKGSNLEIVGFASDTGTEARNMDLSFARALAVESLLENKYGVPAGKMSYRQAGSSTSEPPPFAFEQFGNTPNTWRAWNRRVELNLSATKPLTNDVYDRIIAYLLAPSLVMSSGGRVRNAWERDTTIRVAELLKDEATDGHYIFSGFEELKTSLNQNWYASAIAGRYMWYLDPFRWHLLPGKFGSDMRAELEDLGLDALDELLASSLVGAVRNMNKAADSIHYGLLAEAADDPRSKETAQVVLKELDHWIQEQIENDDSVYSVLRQP